MGWKCYNCGNTEEFVEINKVQTDVLQELNTTKIKKIINKTMSESLLDVLCKKCASKNVKWIEISQTDDFLFSDDFVLTEEHNIGTMCFELTTKCDIDCKYCPRGKKEELDYTLIKRLLDENFSLQKPIRSFELGWDMGNPLLHSKIKDIMELFSSFDCNVNILTNGKNFVNNIKNLNISNANVTLFLDHTEKETNDIFMGKGVYDGTTKALKWLNKHKIKTYVYMRMGRHNFDQIKDMKTFCDKNDATFIPTEIYPLGSARESMLMTDNMKQKAICDIENLGLKKSIHFSEPSGNCTYLRKLRLFVDSSGFMSFCHFLNLSNARIINANHMSLLELIQKNNKVRMGFVKNKNKKISSWQKPRMTASPCSYCLYAFGLNKKW